MLLYYNQYLENMLFSTNFDLKLETLNILERFCKTDPLSSEHDKNLLNKSVLSVKVYEGQHTIFKLICCF